MTRIGAYPGSFNPPTVAHLAIAEAALAQRRLDRVDLVVSRVALAKEEVSVPRFEHRIAVLESVVAHHAWLGLVVTEHQLVVDLARGYDLVIMGADKWAQVNDPAFYGGVRARDRALAALPEVAVAPRPPHPTPPGHRLVIADGLVDISSTEARAGASHLMLPAAAAFDARSGAWSDPDRYRRWATTR